MSKRRKKTALRGVSPMPVLEPNAAGVDIGATEIYIAVPGDRDVEPVRRFAGRRGAGFARVGVAAGDGGGVPGEAEGEGGMGEDDGNAETEWADGGVLLPVGGGEVEAGGEVVR